MSVSPFWDIPEEFLEAATMRTFAMEDICTGCGRMRLDCCCDMLSIAQAGQPIGGYNCMDFDHRDRWQDENGHWHINSTRGNRKGMRITWRPRWR